MPAQRGLLTPQPPPGRQALLPGVGGDGAGRGESCPRPCSQSGLAPAEPGRGTAWEGLALHLCLPLPGLPSLASPPSGTDVPLSRNSSYLVNQSLAGAPEKAIWFSAEPGRGWGRGDAQRCPRLPQAPGCGAPSQGARPSLAPLGKKGSPGLASRWSVPGRWGWAEVAGRLPPPGPGRKAPGGMTTANPVPSPAVMCPVSS